MALQYIFGNSGSGKSEYIYSTILEKSKAEPGRNFFIVVPEQFTIETQRDFVLRQEKNGIMNIDVVSFNRLAYRVFDELGMQNQKILEETGKNFVLRKVAEKKKEELAVLGSNCKKTGYISEIKSVISELTQYRIDPDMLNEFLENERNPMAFRMKLKDINIIYQEFLAFIEGNFITAEELLEVLSEFCKESRILKDCVIVLDGFTGFTPIQFHLLAELMKIVKDIYVAVTLDEREDPWHFAGMHELFFMSKNMISNLSKLAVQTKMEIAEPVEIWHDKRSRFSGSEQLLWLEQNLFRKRQNAYKKEVDDLLMYSIKNPREEVVFAAEEISRLVREEGYRYKDIAIVCGDMEMYGNYVDEIFEIYDIPRFLDRKKNLMFHPMTEFIRGALLLIEYDFSYEHVFAFLRLNLSGYEKEEIDLLENYVLANRIRGFSKWREKWIRLHGIDKEEDLIKINKLRSHIAGTFENSFQVLRSKKKNVFEKTKELYMLLYDNEMEKKLKGQEELFLQEGEVALAKEYEQVYKIVMDLLDKFVDLLGDETMTVREYREILEAGFEAASIGIVPPGYDRVMCGDIERTRLSHIKILFFVGVNDGFIPKEAGKGGIISEQERELLSENNLELAPSIREKNFIQKFYLYLNVTKPSEKLYITWFRVNSDGKEGKRSYLINVLKNIFPKLMIHYPDKQKEEGRIITPKGSRAYFTEKLIEAKEGNVSPVFKALYWWYANHEEWSRSMKSFFQAAFAVYDQRPMKKEITESLYGSIFENSVSRLERYCACAFSHFLTYGLLLKERDLGELVSSDMGSMFHESIERYAAKMEELGYHWFDVPEHQKKELMEEAVLDTIADTKNAILFDGARNSYVIERMKRILVRTIESISKQIEESNFSPEGYEISFSFAKDIDDVSISLSQKEKMRLKGRIDRLDTRKEEDKIYVKVVDYKSGNTQFQLVSVYYGLQLQLVVYLDAAMELMKKKYPERTVLPSGMFYYHIDDPVIEGTSEISDEEIKEKILEQLKLKGVGCDTEDKSVSKKSETAKEGQMRLLSKYVNHKIQTAGKEIYEGNISISPYMLGDKTGCDYCPYMGICGFDRTLPGYEYRRLPEMKKNEVILEKMRGEVGDDGDEMDK